MSKFFFDGEEIEFAPVTGPLFTKEQYRQFAAREAWEAENGCFYGDDDDWAAFMADDWAAFMATQGIE